MDNMKFIKPNSDITVVFEEKQYKVEYFRVEDNCYFLPVIFHPLSGYRVLDKENLKYLKGVA